MVLGEGILVLGVSSPYRPRKRFHSRLSHARLLTQAARVAPGLRVLATRAEPGRSLAGGGESPTCGEITPAHKQPMILSHTPTSVHARFLSCSAIPGVGKPVGKFLGSHSISGEANMDALLVFFLIS